MNPEASWLPSLPDLPRPRPGAEHPQEAPDVPYPTRRREPAPHNHFAWFCAPCAAGAARVPRPCAAEAATATLDPARPGLTAKRGNGKRLVALGSGRRCRTAPFSRKIVWTHCHRSPPTTSAVATLALMKLAQQVGCRCPTESDEKAWASGLRGEYAGKPAVMRWRCRSTAEAGWTVNPSAYAFEGSRPYPTPWSQPP